MKWLIYIALIPLLASCKKDKDSASIDDHKLSLDSIEVVAASIPNAIYTDLTFTNATTGYALSAKFIAKTTNGGLSWDSIPLPMENSWSKIQFTDASHGYIIGGDNTAGYLMKSVDAGQTWELIQLDALEKPWGMHFLDNNTGFITGTWFFKKTTDGGHTWTDVRFQRNLYYDIKFRNASVGYATSSRGAYFKTTDGGHTWDSLQFSKQSYFVQVHYIDNETLLETAQDSVINLSQTAAVMKVPQAAEKLLFIDRDHAIGAGSHYEQGYFPYGDLFVTNTGWKTFTQKTYTTSFAVRYTAMAKMSSNKAMILGFGFEGTKVLVLGW